MPFIYNRHLLALTVVFLKISVCSTLGTWRSLRSKMDLLDSLRLCLIASHRINTVISTLTQKISRYASEFVGTFTLVAAIKLIIASQGAYSPSLAPFGVGLTLMVIVSMFGYISLAQFNPSVTLGFVIRNYEALPRSDWIQWIMYIILQFAGGICGGMFLRKQTQQKNTNKY